MGGVGSNRWGKHCGKIAIEECISLEFQKLLPLEHERVGTINCSNIFENPVIPVTYNLIIVDTKIVNIIYSIRGKDVHLSIRLVDKINNFNRNNILSICPICNKARANHLYIPPKEHIFGCRKCYNLTYWSSRRRYSYYKKNDLWSFYWRFKKKDQRPLRFGDRPLPEFKKKGDKERKYF